MGQQQAWGKSEHSKEDVSSKTKESDMSKRRFHKNKIKEAQQMSFSPLDRTDLDIRRRDKEVRNEATNEYTSST